MILTEASVRAGAARVHDRIRAAGAEPGRVTVVAVTKGFGPDVVPLARAAGLGDLGENYAQELLAKVTVPPGAGPAPTWHFLGRLQTNKVRLVAPYVGLWQSIDRPQLVREVAKRAPGAAILVQVNLSGEAHKGGCAFDAVPVLAGLASDEGLDVRGLMGVGVAGDPDGSRPAFERLVALADAMELPVRSIGMSADLEVAVQAGATMVRIGQGLFGPRPSRAVS